MRSHNITDAPHSPCAKIYRILKDNIQSCDFVLTFSATPRHTSYHQLSNQEFCTFPSQVTEHPLKNTILSSYTRSIPCVVKCAAQFKNSVNKWKFYAQTINIHLLIPFYLSTTHQHIHSRNHALTLSSIDSHTLKHTDAIANSPTNITCTYSLAHLFARFTH